MRRTKIKNYENRLQKNIGFIQYSNKFDRKNSNMYFSIIILLFLLLICLLFGVWRKHIAIKKVCSLSCEEKCRLLNSILSPFGYVYDAKQDIISTLNDAWQRKAGYTALFDRAALHFHMVFDALPIYFNYRGRTWLIEFWKGQYGINTGAEVGIYYADRILDEEEYGKAHFQAVDDCDRLPVTFTLLHGSCQLATVSGLTWWLTMFFVGMFSRPSSLAMDCILNFPNMEMHECFTAALRQTAPNVRFHCHGCKVHLHYDEGCPLSPVCPSKISWFRKLRIRWAQFCNRICCRLYCFITRHFDCTLNKILYLYFLLPFVLRRMLRHLKGVIRA